jgi:hypothetical protein
MRLGSASCVVSPSVLQYSRIHRLLGRQRHLVGCQRSLIGDKVKTPSLVVDPGLRGVGDALWRLPIAELNTSSRTRVQLAASTILLPHWGGLARAAGGLVLLVLVAFHASVSRASLALLPLIAAVTVSYVAASAVLARIGVARPNFERHPVRRVLGWPREGAATDQHWRVCPSVPPVDRNHPNRQALPAIDPLPARNCAVCAGVAHGCHHVASSRRPCLRGLGTRLAAAAPTEQQREADKHA